MGSANANMQVDSGKRKNTTSMSFRREEILCGRSGRGEDGSRLLAANILLGYRPYSFLSSHLDYLFAAIVVGGNSLCESHTPLVSFTVAHSG